ncbi:MAG TPA: hypothetical protein VFL77_07385 [Solirubrobacterales bacterium]|nr:hypothetical protein [Solirubrobacterales bacterium]
MKVAFAGSLNATAIISQLLPNSSQGFSRPDFVLALQSGCVRVGIPIDHAANYVRLIWWL